LQTKLTSQDKKFSLGDIGSKLRFNILNAFGKGNSSTASSTSNTNSIPLSNSNNSNTKQSSG